MAKQSIREAATAGKTVLDRIAAGNAQAAENTLNTPDVKDVKDVLNAQNAQRAKKPGGRPKIYDEPLERLNLKIPAELKAYLLAAAYRESTPKHLMSVTEYLCKLVREDMEKHKKD